MPTPHKHAALIKKWADNPKLQFEFSNVHVSQWKACPGVPLWDEQSEYRVAKQTMTINGHSFLEPESEAPEDSTEYFVPCFVSTSRVNVARWGSSQFEFQLLAEGLVHLTASDAAAHAKALLSLTTQENLDANPT